MRQFKPICNLGGLTHGDYYTSSLILNDFYRGYIGIWGHSFLHGHKIKEVSWESDKNNLIGYDKFYLKIQLYSDQDKSGGQKWAWIEIVVFE